MRLNNKDKKTILVNLTEQHHGKKVNAICAIRGIDSIPNSFRALDELIHDGFVKRTVYSFTSAKGRKYTLPLYQYNFLKQFIPNRRI